MVNSPFGGSLAVGDPSIQAFQALQALQAFHAFLVRGGSVLLPQYDEFGGQLIQCQ